MLGSEVTLHQNIVGFDCTMDDLMELKNVLTIFYRFILLQYHNTSDEKI
jgi:hypothetical protein